MAAIDYVVRDRGGALNRGVIADGTDVSAVTLSGGDEVSFNVRRDQIRGFQRSDNSLVMELSDGRLVVIENYFSTAGGGNRLYISSDGFLNSVDLVASADGTLVAQYGVAEQWGKWSPSDDLIYLGGSEVAPYSDARGDEDTTMLAAGALGGSGGGAALAALGGLAALALLAGGGDGDGGGGDGGGDGGGGDGDGGGGDGGTPVPNDPLDPYVNDPESETTIGGDGADLTLTVSGGGQPGTEVYILVGDKSQTTTIGSDATFSVVFDGDNFPSDGDYETIVTFTDTNDVSVDLDGPGFLIDTTPPAVTVTSGAGSVGDSFNAAGMAAGVTIAGTSEAGAKITAIIQGVSRTTTVAADGTWSLTWQAGVLADGDYTSDFSIVASDAVGNTTTITDTLIVDTIQDVTINTSIVETDGVINADERADGITITGTATAGSSVLVDFGGFASTTVTADANGNWSANFAASAVPTGETTVTVTATGTDDVGNSDTATGTVEVDTLVDPFTETQNAGGADGVINIQEAASGVVFGGAVEPGSTVVVQFGTVTRPATVSASGAWTVTFGTNDIPAGEYTATMTATATDAAGNTAVLTETVGVDTVANAVTINTPVETDDVINNAEASDGVTLSGSSTPGATIQITMGGVTHNTTTAANGTWQSFFAASEVAPGTYSANISATSTDAAGNVATTSHTVQVDTQVDNFAISPVEGDDLVNAVERSDGVLVSGTVEVGSTVQVTLGTASANATVDAAGNWSVVFPTSQVPEGEYNANLRVFATDQAGNTAELTNTVEIDTQVVPLEFGPTSTSTTLEGDGIINQAEALDGVPLSGLVEPGSTVTVNFGGYQAPATVDAAGNWSVNIPASAITAGTYQATVLVTATDPAGNTDSIQQVVGVDTTVPDEPTLAAFTRDTGGIRSISTDGNDATHEVSQVTDAGAITPVAATTTYIAGLDETLYAFTTNVPDGSDMVISAVDAAGNRSGTYIALDDENPGSNVSLANPALGNFQIEAVDLQFAEQSTLTLTEAQIVALSDTSNTLTVHGGLDDTVQITGAVRTGTTTVDGQVYDTYDVGAATLIIDEDITVTP